MARRYDVTASLVFNRLRDPRVAFDGSAEEGPRFLPVEMFEETSSAEPPAARADNRIGIDLAGGHSLKISGTCDPDALARLIRGLSA